MIYMQIQAAQTWWTVEQITKQRNKQIFRLEEEVVQLTEKNKTQRKNMADAQTKHSADTEKLRKKLADLQSELLAKTDEVRRSEVPGEHWRGLLDLLVQQGRSDL